MTRILIADDQPMVRTALSRLIDEAGEHWQICGAADNGREAVDQAAALKPDVVILDMRMPQMDGISAGRAIHAISPSTPVLIYTMFEAGTVERAARAAGLQGVVQKSKGAVILQAIRDVLSGKTVFTDEATAGALPSEATTSADAQPDSAASSLPTGAGGAGSLGQAQQRRARARRPACDLNFWTARPIHAARA